MGLQIRDDRQMKALTGWSQAQFDHLLPYFRTIYASTQQKTYVEGVAAGTRMRILGGGSKGKLPTMAEKLQFVLYYYRTYPTFDVLGTQFAMARSKAHANLHKGIVSGSSIGGLHFAQPTRGHPTTLNVCYYVVVWWPSTCEMP